MNTLTFDIETIPSRQPLSSVLEEALQQKILREQTYNTVDSYDTIRKKIMATNPVYGEIVTIGVQLNDMAPYAIIGDEDEILSKFWELLKNFNGLFIHFNGLRFDIPFILTRSQHYKLLPTNDNFKVRRRFSYFPHFDCYAAATDWYDSGKTINLKTLCDFLSVKGSKDGEVVAANVADYIAQGRIDLVAEYCKQDVRATKAVYDIQKHYV